MLVIVKSGGFARLNEDLKHNSSALVIYSSHELRGFDRTNFDVIIDI